MPTAEEVAYMNWLQNNQRMADNASARSGRFDQQMAVQAYYDQLARADALSQGYQQQQDAHRQDTENRYLDILSGRLGTRDRALADLSNYGQSQIADTNQTYDGMRTQAEADIHARGFGGSPTMLQSARRSVEDARNRSLNRVNDDIINRRVGTDVGLSDSVFGFMERRRDVPPDLNQLIQLQRGLGMSGGIPSVAPPPGWPPGGAAGRTLPQQPNRQPIRFGQGPIAPPFQAGMNNWLPMPDPTLANVALHGGGGAGGVRGLPPGHFLPMPTGNSRMPTYPMVAPPQRPQFLQRGQTPDLMGPNPMARYLGGGYDPNPIAPGRDMAAAMTGNLQMGQTVPAVPGMLGGPMGGGSMIPSRPPMPFGSPYGQSPWRLYRMSLGAEAASRRAQEASIRERTMGNTDATQAAMGMLPFFSMLPFPGGPTTQSVQHNFPPPDFDPFAGY